MVTVSWPLAARRMLICRVIRIPYGPYGRFFPANHRIVGIRTSCVNRERRPPVGEPARVGGVRRSRRDHSATTRRLSQAGSAAPTHPESHPADMRAVIATFSARKTD